MRWFAAAIALLILLPQWARADAPTLDDLQKSFKAGDYAAVVKGAADALGPGGTSDGDQRYKIASLKADAHLELRQADEAVSALNAAVKETQDLRLQSIAQATVILIGRSRDFIYTSLTIKPPPPPKVLIKSPSPGLPPPTPPLSQPLSQTTQPASRAASSPTTRPRTVVILPRGQFDIIDPIRRHEALANLWIDERADAEKDIKQKLADKTLVSLSAALDRVNAASPIAIAAGWGEWPLQEKSLISAASHLDANLAMRQMNLTLTAISKEQVKRRHGQHPKPMPQDERNQINAISQSLDQLTQALGKLPDALGLEADAYKSELDQAARLSDRATTILATD
jgi:hypothetical protein